jgi:sigma-B regulation protein RsbU (phosphoserine phosphatase)
MARGDRLYFYSDGLPEVRNAGRESFRLPRVLSVLDQCRDVPIQESIRRLLRAVEEWCGPVSPQDDISVLAVEIT